MTDNEVIKALEICKQEYENMFDIARKQKAEIERLANENTVLKIQKNAFNQEIEAKAIRRLADRIKKHLKKNGFIWCSEVEKHVKELTDNTFDNLNGSNSTGLEKIDHNSLCETETFEGR